MVSAPPAIPAWAPPERTLDLPGRGELWVRDSGDQGDGRPAIVLLHGWAVTSDLNWFTAYESLARHHRVIALDHRGHGRGLRPRGGIVHLPDCADDTAAALDALGVERATPVGYSMGGAVAQLLWYHHRDRVDGLVLCATSRHFQGGPISDVLYRSQRLLASVAHGADAPARRMLAARIDRRVADDEHAEWMRSELRRTDPAAALSAMSSVGRFRSSNWIARVDVPAAVLVHTRDRTVPPRRQRGLADAIPGAARYDIEAPHDAVVTQAATYVPLLTAAVEGVTGAGDGPGGTV